MKASPTKTSNTTDFEESGEWLKPGWMTSLLGGNIEEPEEVEEPPKARICGTIGHAIVDDFRQTIGTHWKSEMTNFNQKTIAVSFFLFFACIVSCFLLD